MYKLCKTEQSAARQKSLEQGLLLAMLGSHYEEISVSDLCEQIGIPRKSFYRYFSSKDGALYALIDHTILEYESFQGEQRSGEPQSHQAELERFFQFWLQHKALLDALKRSNISGVLVTRAVAQAMTDAGLSGRHLQQDEKAAWRHAIMFSVCGLMSMVLDWHASGYDLPARQMAVIATKLLTEPLFRTGDIY